MAVTAEELEGFTVQAERKPEKSSGVTVSQMPKAFLEMLAVEAPKALADKDYEIVVRLPVRAELPKPLTEKQREDEKAVAAFNEATKVYEEKRASAVSTVKQLALYATGWGKVQDPKLYITKIPNRKDDKDEPMARLSVRLDSEVSQNNRPGRR